MYMCFLNLGKFTDKFIFCFIFVGLQYITEFQKKDEKIAPRYVCNLCEAKCDGNSILSHVIGIKHRLHYFVSL